MTDSTASLALENGVVLTGNSVGAPGERSGDLVFHTGMSGYHEILTDPSYSGQVVLMSEAVEIRIAANCDLDVGLEDPNLIRLFLNDVNKYQAL